MAGERRREERGERREEERRMGGTLTVTVWSGPWTLGPVCDDISKEYVHLTHVHLTHSDTAAYFRNAAPQVMY